jgi:hypothetical protein
LVRVTDAAVLRRVDALLGQARRPPGAGSAATWEFSLDVGHDRSLPGGKVAHGIHSLYVGCRRMFRGRGVDVAIGSLIASMRDLACSPQNEFLRVRAGGVAFGDRALLLPSAPEPHLSALVAILVRGGGTYLGDELVKIDPVLRQAHPVRLPPLVDVRDLPMFPELDSRVVVSSSRRRVRGALTPRHAVSLAELGGIEAEPAEIGWVAFPRFVDGAETTVKRVALSEGLFRAAQASLNLHVWGDRGLRLMGDVLSRASIAEVVTGSPQAGADALTSWLESAA